VQVARGMLATYEDMAEMIRLGAYRKGADAQVDQAIQYYPAIENFIRQRKDEKTDLTRGYAELAQILGIGWQG
jgi:flagellum-specific ATP synthase